MRDALFTISKGANGFDFKCEHYSSYNRFSVPGSALYKTMEELADFFNETIGVAVFFDIE